MALVLPLVWPLVLNLILNLILPRAAAGLQLVAMLPPSPALPLGRLPLVASRACPASAASKKKKKWPGVFIHLFI
jgi:hypothetical protein